MSRLAILGGEPVRKDPYPQWPVHDQRDIEAAIRVIQSGNWGGYPYPGPETRSFLDKFVEMQSGGTPLRLLTVPSRWRLPCALPTSAGGMK
jgi:hypothetical protein